MDLFWESGSALELLVFDATPRTVVTAGASVTEHAVERGANVADHVRPSARKITVEAVVSNSPSTVPSTQMSGVGGRVRSLDLNGGKTPELTKGAAAQRAAEYERRDVRATAEVLQFDGPFDRRQRVWEQLDGLRSSSTIVSATTELGDFDDCVISDLSAPVETKTGDAIVFSLTLTQIRFASTQIVEVPEPEEPRGRPTVDTGATGTEEVPPTSALFDTFGGVFGLGGA